MILKNTPRIEVDKVDLGRLIALLVEALPTEALLFAGRIADEPKSRGIFSVFLKSATDLVLYGDGKQLELGTTATQTSAGGHPRTQRPENMSDDPTLAEA